MFDKSTISIENPFKVIFLQRSSSIPSLHSFKSSNGRGKNDYPEVSLYDLSKLYGSKEEGFHFFSNQKPQNLGSIIFNGRLLQAKPNYGIFMTLNVNSGYECISGHRHSSNIRHPPRLKAVEKRVEKLM